MHIAAAVKDCIKLEDIAPHKIYLVCILIAVFAAHLLSPICVNIYNEYRRIVLLQIDFDILRRRLMFPSDVVRLYE